jgi:hypothetical protein
MQTVDNGGNVDGNMGKFVMLASEIRKHPHPNPHYDLNPMHISKSESLLHSLKKEAYKPWLEDFQLKATMSRETWMKRDRDSEESIALGNGRSYTRLRFRCQASSEVHITKGLEFLEFTKSRAEGLSWVVVDVVVEDDAHLKDLKEQVEYCVARRSLIKAAESSPMPRLLESLPLSRQHYKELMGVCHIRALVDAFTPLTNPKLECLWPRLDMAMFSNMRKCWCFEVSQSIMSMRTVQN